MNSTTTRWGIALAAVAAAALASAGCRLAPGDCRDERDCASSESCVPPFSPAGCGACFTAMLPCSDDAECDAVAAGLICEPVFCACDAAELGCTPGCTRDDQCIEGSRCGASGRCEALPCTAVADCPAQFDCSAAGSCARRACSGDSGCAGAGYCVGGLCYDGPGTCEGPVP